MIDYRVPLNGLIRNVVLLLLTLLPTVSPGMTELRGQDVWQLCNICSDHCLALEHGSTRIHARGNHSDPDCSTDFNVLSVDFGVIRLQHALTKRYLCMSSKKKLTTKLNGGGDRCAFVEHMDEMHYTRLENVQFHGTYLAFNRKGRFLANASTNQWRCVQFNKYQRRVSDTERRSCCRREQRCRVDREAGVEPPKKEEEPPPSIQDHLTRITDDLILKSLLADSNDLLDPYWEPTTTTTHRPFDQHAFLSHLTRRSERMRRRLKPF
ncbi:egl-17 [Pristionchus pacificus]|uniref:EGL-17 n=1 Tax=Pristionchus pacificus TaxID=54126 RepID=Q27ZK1_PRIPA|nr:EGL-17 [Pristionchus pacificus]KAF8380999.1 egl-17 [Pristionchus pacificus]|eukprot:PDM75107.1 egl-17 [Pristionchus pacificus]